MNEEWAELFLQGRFSLQYQAKIHIIWIVLQEYTSVKVDLNPHQDSQTRLEQEFLQISDILPGSSFFS